MLFQELSKIKRSSIMTSIILVAIGIVMIMCPAQYVDSLVSVLGYVMVVAAIVMMLNFISAKKSLINYIKLVGSLICTGVPVGFFVRRRRRKLKKQAEEDAARAAEAAEREAEVYEPTYEEREAAAKELVAELADSVCPKVY